MFGRDKYIMQLSIPFNVCEDELVYVASEEDEQINQIIAIAIKHFNHLFAIEHINVEMICLPMLEERLKLAEVQHYWAPYENNEEKTLKNWRFGNDYMLRYFSREDRECIKQGFLWIKSSENNSDRQDVHIYEFFPLSSESLIPLREQFFRIYQRVRRALCDDDVHYCLDCSITSSIEHGRSILETEPAETVQKEADELFNSQLKKESIDDLLADVRERVKVLRQRGVAEHILSQLIQPEEKPSRLVITQDYRLLLPDYQNLEIKMEPLVKAVFLLFLNHPEGIRFKELPDYRKELTEIYLRMKPNGLTEKVRKSIEDVTNPMSNSINEKCARIRGAFVGQFDNHLAKHYYIDGARGEPKKIALPRELVVWE